jgi:hypothetical protein
VDWGRDTHATGGWGFDGRADGPRRPIEWFGFEWLSVSIGASRMMRPTGELLTPRPQSPDAGRGADAGRKGIQDVRMSEGENVVLRLEA